MSDPEAFRVYAVKYAEKDGRRSEHFLGGDPHDGPMPMDYFVWAVVGPGGTWVVDTGFTRGRTRVSANGGSSGRCPRRSPRSAWTRRRSPTSS